MELDQDQAVVHRNQPLQVTHGQKQLATMHSLSKSAFQLLVQCKNVTGHELTGYHKPLTDHIHWNNY